MVIASIRCFLSNRSQFVIVHLPVMYLGTQGNVLGPVRFILLIL